MNQTPLTSAVSNTGRLSSLGFPASLLGTVLFGALGFGCGKDPTIDTSCPTDTGVTDDRDHDGYVEANDCNDLDASIHPDAVDIWYDGVDRDCAGNDDYDADNDGYDVGSDCDDHDASIHPGAPDTWYDGIDSDCAGNDDYDADNDGYELAVDCNDEDASIHPDAYDEWYDGVDSDCAGDDDYDADADGYDAADYGGDDCDDTDASIHPVATDTWYDGVDSDCAGDDDYDADGDGYGLDTDCNDHDASIHPGATDTWYDGIDSDCAGNDDYDADSDGYDSDAYGGDDCDDTDASIHPGAVEIWYDGIDSDCAGDNDFDQDGDGCVLGDDFDDTDALVCADPADLVDLGAAGSFVILAKSGISTVPYSDVVGDIGVSPAAATYITGFSLIMDASNVFSTSTQVTGNVYASDYSLPTPGDLTTAVGDMETAFTDAAGRAPDVTELGAGSIGGMTLPSGVYKWGTGLLIASDLTLDGGMSEVWIFQVANDLTVSNGVAVHLTGGAMPEHVYWQVSGLAQLGTTAHVEGVILSQTAVTLDTLATVDGRLMAQTAVTLDQNTVVEPAP